MIKRGFQVIAVLFFLTVVALWGCYFEALTINTSQSTRDFVEEIQNNDEIIEEHIEETVINNNEPSTEEVFVEVVSNEIQIPEMPPQYLIETEYDEKIVVENGLEIHYIAGDTFRGVMTVVADPSRVFVGTPKENYDGTPGASATAIAKRYNALYAVNGAFFVDTNFAGNGGTPIGFVFSEGKLKAGGTGSYFTLMGLDNNNNFVIESMTGAQAIERGIRDAVTCKPILVKNGQITDLNGASLTLIDARTCIGATAEGYILFLTIDGRMSHSFGATTRNCAEVMLAFGAVNAGNLDGGGSVSIYYEGETPLDPGLSSLKGSRASPEAICIRRE